MSMDNGGASVETLKAEIATLQSDLGSVVDTLTKLSARVSGDNFDKARQMGATAKQRVADVSMSAERAIVERPFTSTAVAFGVGFLVGKLLDRH